MITQKTAQLEQQSTQLREKGEELQQRDLVITQKTALLEQQSTQLREKGEELQQKETQLQQRNADISRLQRDLQRMQVVCIKVHVSLSQLCTMSQSEEGGVGGVVTPPAIN